MFVVFAYPKNTQRDLIASLASVNGAAYTRGAREQYDAWSTLLEPSESDVGWNWDGLSSYMKKVL